MDFGKMKKGHMGENDKKAKLSVLKSLRKQAMDMMKDDVDGMKSVKVSSNSKKGLSKGLDAAEDLLNTDTSGEHPEHEDHIKNEAEMFGKREDEFGGDDDSFSDDLDDDMEDADTIDAKIQRLMAKKDKLKSRG